jgi:hypothetical protein
MKLYIQSFQNRPRKSNDFGVGLGLRRAEAFHAKLYMLAVAPLLRALIAETGSDIITLKRQSGHVQTMLDKRPRRRSRAFGAQCQ